MSGLRKGLATALALAIVGVAAGCSSVEGEPQGDEVVADLILHGGIVITMDTERDRASAIAVAGSEIVAVGGDELLDLAGPETVVVDLE